VADAVESEKCAEAAVAGAFKAAKLGAGRHAHRHRGQVGERSSQLQMHAAWKPRCPRVCSLELRV
jgi:hypothetical protein